MRGIILAGGTGSRLEPLTNVTNKHLLPVYNKPMIYYPLFTLKKAGITNILIVSGKGHAGSFLELLGSGESMGLKLSYEVQEEAGGIAQALGLAEGFANNEKVAVVLGDNVYGDDLSEAIAEFKLQPRGAKVFLKSVENPTAYGVANLTDGKITKIVEKPANPESNLAVTGCYLYDPQVFDIISGLEPSARNELEITDVNNFYLEQGTLRHMVLEDFWGDCGESFDSLLHASKLVQGSYLAGMTNDLNVVDRGHQSVSDAFKGSTVDSTVSS